MITKTIACVATAALLTNSAFAATNSLPTITLKNAYPALSFNRPLWLEEVPDGSHRTVVVEQDGQVWLLPPDHNSADKKLFIDISERKPHVQNEEGLLAFAFHPDFKSNGKFYLYYSQQSPKRSVLSEFQTFKSNPSEGDLSSERIVLTVPQPYWNHNGGTVVFGPDGYLYLSLGDGGAGNDPHGFGQSLHFLLAKILRIDVNSRTGKLPYGVPKDNPFVAKDEAGNLKPDPFDTKPEGVRPEIWAYGLRNVWRMSFDRETGALWAGDVGQNNWEEVNVITKGGNYGWNAREGFHDFKKTPIQGKPIDPIIEYAHNANLATNSVFADHGVGVSITGGYVYRGKKIPALRGVYVYADYQMGTIWGLRYENGKLTDRGTLSPANAARQISSFGEDRDGEIYAISFDGKIYQLSPASP